MSADSSFEEILNQPASGIKRPPPVPVGTYTALVKGLPEYGESQQKKTKFARFQLELIGSNEEHDPEYWQGKTLRRDVWLTPDSLWRAKAFAEHCGIDVEGMSVGEALESCNGCQLQILVKHRPEQDGDGLFAEISKTGPL